MMPKFFTYGATLLLLILLLSSSALKAQSNDEQEKNQKLFKEILYRDSLFWEAYNTCNLEASEAFFTEDLEFYHDKGGITKTRKNLMEAVAKGLCGNENWRLRREAVEGSINIFPLADQGEIYGAILSGEHLFFINEKGKKEYLDGIARFTHVWLKEDGEWKMSRVLSYDHRPPTGNPNEKKGVSLSNEILNRYVGDYEGAQKRKIIITNKNNVLELVDGDFHTNIYPTSENTFYLKDRNIQFEFVKDKSNKTLKMIVRENGNVVEEVRKIK